MGTPDRSPAGSMHTGFGIPELDIADRDMVVRAQVLNQAIADRADAAEIQRQVNRFVREAVAHFRHEERVLWESGYPLVKGHAALHIQMLAELEHAREALCSIERRAAWAEYGLLIKQLVTDHFREEAIRYRDFLGLERRQDTPGS
jgi:hemerythrin